MCSKGHLAMAGENYFKHCTIIGYIEVYVDSCIAICVQHRNSGKKIDYKRAFDSNEPLILWCFEVKNSSEETHRRRGVSA